MRAAFLLFPALFVAGVVQADQTTDAKAAGAGRALYLQYCASCHGTDGKGGGPAAAAQKTPPANLTTLPLKNGKFDEARVRTSIDGTQAASAHGSRDMPVWGKVLSRGERRGAGAAQTDIWLLTEYIRSLQAPAKP